MQHIWEENKCLRCKIIREQRSEKVSYGFSMGSYIRHYTIYYVNGIQTETKPRCYFPGQLKLFDNRNY